jgi:hypothetical protein
MLGSEVPSDDGELISGAMILDARESGGCVAQGKKLARGFVGQIGSDGKPSDEHGSEAINDAFQFFRVLLLRG